MLRQLLAVTAFIALAMLFFLPRAALAAEAVPPSTEYMEAHGTPYPPPERVAAPSGEAMIADLILVRPASIVALALGLGVSIVATPLALVSGTTGPVYEKLVVEPYNYLVCRPLGLF